MVTRPPVGIMPFERIAIFVDGWNFKYATFDSFDMRVDFTKFLDYFRQNSILLRSYYYTGEWDASAIEWYIRLTQPENPEARKKELEDQAQSERNFWRFLNRNGYKVVRKPVRIQRLRDGRISPKADLDLELAIDMLTLADKCEKQILVSGDGDFIPLVEAIQSRGVRVVVVSTQHPEAWSKAHFRASDELLDAADEVILVEHLRKFIEREDRPSGRGYGS